MMILVAHPSKAASSPPAKPPHTRRLAAGLLDHFRPPPQVERFVEKPAVFVGNKINAGIYVLNPRRRPPRHLRARRGLTPRLTPRR